MKLIKDIRKEGFKAVKLQTGARWENPQDILDVVKAIRDELGNKTDIMVDVMQAWLPHPYDFPTALKLARGLEKYG